MPNKRNLKEFIFPGSEIIECNVVKNSEGKEEKQALVRHYRHGISANGTNFTLASSESFRVVLEESPVMFCNHSEWDAYSRRVQDAVSYHIPGTFDARADGVYSKVAFYDETPLAEEVFAKASATPEKIGISVHGYCETEEEELEDGRVVITPLVWISLASSDWVHRPAAAGALMKESWRPTTKIQMNEELNKLKTNEPKLKEEASMNEELKKLFEKLQESLSTDNMSAIKELIEARTAEIEGLKTDLQTANDSIATLETEKTDLETAKADLVKEKDQLTADLKTATDEKEKLEERVKNADDQAEYAQIVEELELPDKLKEFVLDEDNWFHKKWIGEERADIEEAMKSLKENLVTLKTKETPDGQVVVEEKETDEDEKELSDDELLELNHEDE